MTSERLFNSFIPPKTFIPPQTNFWLRPWQSRVVLYKVLRFCSVVGPTFYVIIKSDLKPLSVCNVMCKYADDINFLVLEHRLPTYTLQSQMSLIMSGGGPKITKWYSIYRRPKRSFSGGPVQSVITLIPHPSMVLNRLITSDVLVWFFSKVWVSSCTCTRLLLQ